MVIQCPVHGQQPVDCHHLIPKMRGGTDHADNMVTVCRACHQDHHRDDYAMKACGWQGLKRKLEDQGIIPNEYMRSLQLDLKGRLGEEGYRERMRQVRLARLA